MEAILRALKTFEVWIYLLLGLAVIINLRKFVVALNAWRGSIFGLEKDNAQRKINASASMLIMLLMMAASVFLLTTFLFPTIPGLQVLPTPTLTMLMTPTVTLPPSALAQTPGSLAVTPTNMPTVVSQTSGCEVGKLEIISPANGDEVSGNVELIGTVDVENFGFYKYEYSQPGGTIWTTIAAGNQIVHEGRLGAWETSQISVGSYLVRLVVTDNQGQELPPCTISVSVVS